MLDEIVNDVRKRLPALQAFEADLLVAAGRVPPARDFRAALAAPGMSIISEFKRASPSRGIMNADMDPARQATLYESGGAAALSVLTEPDHFDGSAEDLEAARAAVAIPVLRKDFTLHPLHIWEAKVMGADAVLLIAAILSDEVLARLLLVAESAGLAAIVEVHDLDEAHRAVAAGANIVGVNNRDLTTFVVDLATAERLAPVLEEVAVTVAESGILGPSDAARMRDVGYDALLVGEYLVLAEDPAQAIAGLRMP